jgi:hypothetical protein
MRAASPLAINNPDVNEPFDQRIGRCYELAGRVAARNFDAVLVHGSIEGGGKPRIGHAWINLKDGSIWEPATNMIWASDAFHRFFNTRVHASYDISTVQHECARYRHWGPWDGSVSPIALGA